MIDVAVDSPNKKAALWGRLWMPKHGILLFWLRGLATTDPDIR